MKKSLFLLTTISLSLFSCVSDDINNDPNSAYTTVPETLVSYAQKELSDYLNTPNVNENNFRLTMQYWQETTYVNESNYDFTNRNVSNQIWRDNFVNVLNNLNEAKKLLNAYVPPANQSSTWPAKKKNELAIVDIMMVFVYQNLVDTYGDIPYSESLDLIANPLPIYENDSAIYPLLITRLKADIANLGTGGSFGSTEYYYNGDVTKWKKFGNSLLLKLGITLADVNPTLAQATVNEAITGGLMNSSADNCQLPYQASSPNYNPLYENLSASGRDDFFAAKTLVDFMNTTNDARISMYYDTQGTGTTYIGSPTGQGADFADFSSIASFAYTPTTPGTIISYTEVAFYLAEAAARWTPSIAQTAYNNAVSASFLEWGLTSSDATAYLLANPYVASNWKKSIGEQAWVAMYNQAITSWNFYRRLDFPILTAPSTAISGASGKVPVRMQYPVKETTTNPTNWAAAASAIGGDKLTTKIFWDIN
jgi:hypothetical protein